MKHNFTKQQRAAIDQQGSVLVSAAAGSGKTAVLVERIVKLVCREHSPVGIDKLLVVTFTNAAAEELKLRIQKRLAEESVRQPENRWIKRQLLILPSAKIGTIDSFCIDLIRENFEALEISPDFKILDNASLSAIYSKAADLLTKKYYELGDKEFLSLLNALGADYGDDNLTGTIHNLYSYSLVMPFQNDWLDESISHYVTDINDLNNSFWGAKAYEIAKDTIDSALSILLSAEQILQQDTDVINAYLGHFLSYKTVIMNLQKLIDKKEWNKIYNTVCEFKATNKKTLKNSQTNAVAQCVNFATSSAQSAINKIGKLFYDKKQTVLSHLAHCGEYVKTLARLTKEYAVNVDQIMREENAYTFSNIESMALNLLCKKENDNLVLTDHALELNERFYEVLVDEYQDVNNLQDMLFYVLSNKGKKLFVVGDIKQSIYRFRGANPNNFLEKKSKCKDYPVASENENKKVILSNNFRSREGVCEYINFFFSQLMKSQVTEIEYSDEEKLYPLAEFADNGLSDVSVHMLEYDADEFSSITAQAEHVAQYIEQTVNSAEFLRSKNGLRKAEYSDFCILLRATKERQEIFANALKKHSIPVSISVGNFTQSSEVITFMSILRVIDNPTRDVPLLSAMLSPVFRFTAEKIARIRIEFKNKTVYGSVCAAAKNGDETAKNFVEQISQFRRLCTTMTTEKFISYLLDVTGYMNYIYSMSDPQKRRKNCLKILKLAKEYDSFAKTGLSGFIKMFDRIAADDKPSQDAKISGSGVKIMSIHGSKGLQFPICIIADMEKTFNISDTTSLFCKSENLGIAVKYIDYAKNEKVIPLSHLIIGEEIKSSQVAEELRLLYVAMTRAEERLVLLSAASKADKKLVEAAAMQYIQQNSDKDGLYLAAKNATSYNDWLINTLILHPSASDLRSRALGISVLPTDAKKQIEIKNFVVQDLVCELADSKNEDFAVKKDIDLNEIFAYKYPYEQLRYIQAKTSVSNLVHNTNTLSDFSFNEQPSFLAKDGFSPAQKGTILHKFMELANFSDAEKDLESEIYRLVDYKFFTPEQADALSREKIKAFFGSKLYRRISEATLVKHEMQFLSEFNASEIVADIGEEMKDEKIIVQGAVDLIFEENGEIVVVDFKTDRISDEQKLKDLYAQQLEYYSLACAKIFNKPVKEKIIYSLNLSKEIIV